MAKTRVALAIALMAVLVIHAHAVSADSDSAPAAPTDAYSSTMSLFEWARNKFSHMLDIRNSGGNLRTSTEVGAGAGAPTPTPAPKV